jgi:MoxR-like ATPase
MDRVRNPFSPGAGTQPPELSGRSGILEEAAVTLARLKAGRHDRSSLLIGLRGVGKTVLLNRIQTAAEAGGYLPVSLEAPEERRLAELLVPPLRNLLLRLDRSQGRKEKLRRALSALASFAARFKVSIGDIGIGLTDGVGVADSGILDNDVVELLVTVGEAAAERQSAVAVLIDELQYVREPELGALLAGLHRIGQLNLPVVMFGAGLPQLVGLTGRAKSYAERLFRFQEIAHSTTWTRALP